MWRSPASSKKRSCSAVPVTLPIPCQFIRLYDAGKPDAAKVARPVWRGLGGNVRSNALRAALPPYATQLLNAGCRITSIQRFLGHKRLNTTIIYARAHDQTVADDYYTAMNSVENRLNLLGEEGPEPEPVGVDEREELLALAEQLAQPEVSDVERLEIALRMRQVLEGTLSIENGRTLWDRPPPSPVSVG